MQQSEKIEELVGALVRAQRAFRPIPRNADNPFYKSTYADLASVMNAVREPLAENGLAVSQPLWIQDEQLCVVTKLMHISGQWIESRMTVRPVVRGEIPTPQEWGSAITYARRYSLMAILGICQEGEDDDANAASAQAQKATRPTKAPATKKDEKPEGPLGDNPEAPSKEELTTMLEMAKKLNIGQAQILNRFGASSLAELTREQVATVIEKCRARLEAEELKKVVI